MDAESAIEVIHSQPIDMVCLDLALPQESGFSVCRELRSKPETEAVPVLVITARTGLEDYARAMEFGADRFMEKPFKGKELLNNVRELLNLS